MNGFGVMNELDALMPEKGRKAIAAALECDIRFIPEAKDMLKLPLIPQMFAVACCVRPFLARAQTYISIGRVRGSAVLPPGAPRDLLLRQALSHGLQVPQVHGR